MKRIFLISGALAALLLILFLFGAIDFGGNKRDAALSEGNRLLESGKYLEALVVYERGLIDYPEDPELNYNSGQALYSMGEYGRAADFYGKSTLGKPERYLNMGNCRLILGDDTGTGAQYRLQHYKQALECYKQGILEFPQDVSLKYNYEYVQEKISQLEQAESEGEGEEQSGGSEDEGEEQGGGSEGKGEEQSGGSEGEGEEQGGGSEGEGGEQGGGSEGEGGEQGGGSEGAGVQSGSEDYTSEQKQARSVIENALEALEKQEAESLKNNRNQGHIYKEGDYEW